MIIQACINGTRPPGYHARLPMTTQAMVLDGRDCVEAGAGELHLHPRNADGYESLAAVDAVVTGLRRMCPGTLIGVSTGAWIENSAEQTRQRIADWRERPDHASVNLCEPDAPAVMAALRARGVGIEAGLATVEDARRLVTLPDRDSVFRVLIEIEQQDQGAADRMANAIAQVLDAADLTRPILLHGTDATVWHCVHEARARRWSTRVGFEDGCLRADGTPANSNAELVADAVALFGRSAAASART